MKIPFDSMTPENPEQLAESVNSAPDNAVTDRTKQFFLTKPARDIQRFVHGLHVINKERHFELARIALYIRLAEDVDRTSRRIVRLTWFLAFLTLALLAVELRGVLFPKDAAARPKPVQARQNNQVVIPTLTNR
jgi:hypothetical protein